MNDHETFAKLLPFKAIPTNIPGVFTAPPLPDNCDVGKAGPEFLEKHGIFCKPPAPGSDPELIAQWNQVYGGKWLEKDQIIPVFEKREKKKKRTGKNAQASHGQDGSAWGGGVITGKGKWERVYGTWKIPSVSKPDVKPGIEKEWTCASWIGIDGYGTDDVLQAGIDQTFDENGKTSYSPWYEWYPADSYYFDNFQVSAGDEIYCECIHLKLSPGVKCGHILMKNLTTNKIVKFKINIPPKAVFYGNSIEWIMEAYDSSGERVIIPKFSTLKFSKAYGEAEDGKRIGNPKDGIITEIVTDGQDQTSVTLGDKTVTIDYRAQTREFAQGIMTDGTYKLQAKLGELYCNVAGSSMEAEAKIQMWSDGNDGSELFHVRTTNNSDYGQCYTITNKRSGRMCNVSGNVFAKETNIIQYDEYSGSQPNLTSEIWKISDQGDGYYSISPAKDQTLFWNLSGDSPDKGTEVILYVNVPDDHNNNRFKFIKVD